MNSPQNNPNESIFKDRNYNPFANRPMKKKVHTDGMSLSLLHGVMPVAKSGNSSENFYRNASFIMTMFLAGVGLSTLTLLGVFGNVNHAANIARANNIVSDSVAIVYSDTSSSSSATLNTMPTVLGIENQVNGSYLKDGYSIDGDGEYTAGNYSEILIVRPQGSDQKVIYFKDDISKFDIDSPSKFYMDGGWVVVPFDANGEARFKVKPESQGSLTLNMYSDSTLNQDGLGDIGYLLIDAK